MKTFNKHPQWYNQPLRLSEANKQNPVEVLDDFFQCYHLNETREIIWNWLVEVNSSPHGVSQDHHERNNHFFFYKKIEELIEAAFILRNRVNKKAKRKRRKQKRMAANI
jgi:hypothetical protein